MIFDCGASTKKNKEKIRDAEFHYLTLKAKKTKSYKPFIQFFPGKREGKHSEI